MLPDIVAVIHAVLVEPHAGQYLRQEHPQHLRVSQQDLQNVLPAQDPRQLRLDALRGDVRAAMERLRMDNRSRETILTLVERHDCELPLGEKSASMTSSSSSASIRPTAGP